MIEIDLNKIEKNELATLLIEKDSEIERLKADLHEANDSITWWQNRFNSEHKQIEDLKEQVEYQDLWRKEYLSRIDKAIEYMNYTFNISSVKEMHEIMNELEKILQGSDKE